MLYAISGLSIPSGRQSLCEKRQTFAHPVIDAGMVVGELLVAMSNAELVQPAHQREPTPRPGALSRGPRFSYRPCGRNALA